MIEWISNNTKVYIIPGFFLCVFEKLKVKKTQAPEKLKVFSAKKLKVPEVFRPILENSTYQRLKNSRKIFRFASKLLQNTVF